MSFLSDEQRAVMLAHGAARQRGEVLDPYPVLKLYTPDAGACWVLVSLGADGDTAYGLAWSALAGSLWYFMLWGLIARRAGSSPPVIAYAHFGIAAFLGARGYPAESRIVPSIYAGLLLLLSAVLLVLSLVGPRGAQA